eukprot:1788234-Amphidinium_carterae.1
MLRTTKSWTRRATVWLVNTIHTGSISLDSVVAVLGQSSETDTMHLAMTVPLAVLEHRTGRRASASAATKL